MWKLVIVYQSGMYIILFHDTFLPPLGALPKGGHGGEDHNTRTQVTFAVFEEFIHSFSEEGSRLFFFFFSTAQCSGT